MGDMGWVIVGKIKQELIKNIFKKNYFRGGKRCF